MQRSTLDVTSVRNSASPFLPRLAAATAVLCLFASPGAAGASLRPQIVTVVPRPPETTTSTTAVPPTTVPPTTVTPTTAAETKLILISPGTKIVDAGGPGTQTATTVAAPPPNLTAGQVDAVLRSQQRSGVSNTVALIEALKPLQGFGMTAQEALTLGMGQFPVLGVANWTDSWLDPRDGPPPHQHQGNDIFAAFDTPVRAPVDGTLRFEVGGLGGNSLYVTAPDGTYYYLAHLKALNRDLANGATVKQGQIIGSNGASGNAEGGAPHVHFEVHPRGGAAVDPKPYLDAWLAAALAQAPALIASFQPPTPGGSGIDGNDGVPPILVATGLTRRFSTPYKATPPRP